jgi:hypothetical protein
MSESTPKAAKLAFTFRRPVVVGETVLPAATAVRRKSRQGDGPALVTGASRGIGAAITRALERPGDAMIVRGDTL